MHGLRQPETDKANVLRFKMLYIKMHISETKRMLAVCDSELVGKKCSEEEKCLTVSEYFYKGELVNDEKAVIEMKKADSLNIVGKNAVELAIHEGLISKENVFLIDDVPYALVFGL